MFPPETLDVAVVFIGRLVADVHGRFQAVRPFLPARQVPACDLAVGLDVNPDGHGRVIFPEPLQQEVYLLHILAVTRPEPEVYFQFLGRSGTLVSRVNLGSRLGLDPFNDYGCVIYLVLDPVLPHDADVIVEPERCLKANESGGGIP